MNAVDQSFISNWETTRVKGKITFAAKEGLVKGILFSIVIEIASNEVLFNPGGYSFDLNKNSIRLTLFVIVYFFYGLWKWNRNEKRFNQLLKSSKGI
jgi:hypothetical protein